MPRMYNVHTENIEYLLWTDIRQLDCCIDLLCEIGTSLVELKSSLPQS